MRLIDADVVVENIEEWLDSVGTALIGNGLSYTGELMGCIEDAPTVDAIPVVRCRECKHWKPSGSKAGNSFSDMEYIGGCEFTNYYRRESDFCSYGKRKDSDGNG